ncbi:MAG: hypothetical protein DI628_04360 [Blastochloris viridis]|uniref:Uncharacterized protein n=1 Tax=Blastochloris viridis TaxID=1079 RepID=A0A6N4RF17_BLAVI|nr:MAG: hypothetical protein DI628_04360 [Blastochloris viridis]
MKTESLALPEQAQTTLQRVLFQEKVHPSELTLLHKAYAGLFPRQGRTPTLDEIEARLSTDGAGTHLSGQRVLEAWQTLRNEEMAPA